MPEDPTALAKALVDAIHAGNWRLGVVFGLMAVVWVARKYGGKKIVWLNTDKGGTVLVLAFAFLTGISGSLVAGKGVNLGIILDSLILAFGSAGGWTILKKWIPQGQIGGAPKIEAKSAEAALPVAEPLKLVTPATDPEKPKV